MIEERGATPSGKKKAEFVQQLLELVSGESYTVDIRWMWRTRQSSAHAY